MKVCHILPPRVLGEVSDLLGTQHLLLPALMGHSKYRDFYRQRAGVDWLTLDNGVAEGRMVSFNHLISVARAMNVQEIVLPDAMGNMDRTLDLVAQSFFESFEHRKQFRFMFVPQGKTINEVIHCAEQAMNMCPVIINCFGIPRHILKVSPSARAQIAWGLRERFPKVDIHLLGMGVDDSNEIPYYGREFKNAGVRSVDSSLAWNATLQEVDLSDPKSLSYNLSITRQPIEEFAVGSFDHAAPYYVKLLSDNITEINSWVM
jgi:hypothetical protein